ncbi:MAG: hypothetical protein K0Q58_778, partial [Microbacterium sp.]|nr:hypothetical protein [Microbacterium sp.]
PESVAAQEQGEAPAAEKAPHLRPSGQARPATA